MLEAWEILFGNGKLDGLANGQILQWESSWIHETLEEIHFICFRTKIEGCPNLECHKVGVELELRTLDVVA